MVAVKMEPEKTRFVGPREAGSLLRRGLGQGLGRRAEAHLRRLQVLVQVSLNLGATQYDGFDQVK